MPRGNKRYPGTVSLNRKWTMRVVAAGMFAVGATLFLMFSWGYKLPFMPPPIYRSLGLPFGIGVALLVGAEFVDD